MEPSPEGRFRSRPLLRCLMTMLQLSPTTGNLVATPARLPSTETIATRTHQISTDESVCFVIPNLHYMTEDVRAEVLNNIDAGCDFHILTDRRPGSCKYVSAEVRVLKDRGVRIHHCDFLPLDEEYKVPQLHGASPADSSDRKSTRLNSSHRTISYAVICMKKKTIISISTII